MTSQQRPEMTDLVPCNEQARQGLADMLVLDRKRAEYVAKTFPSILLDITRLVTEQATRSAKECDDPALIIREQLKPYHMFSQFLGKCPQLTSLMYSYFEKSSFQPLPEKLFAVDSIDRLTIHYNYAGFTDEVVKEILLSYFKYLTFNPKWFSAVWNWSELGRFIALHTAPDIRYLATSCLSIITRPNRQQHMCILRESIVDYSSLIDLQIKHRHIFDNTFKPCIGTNQQQMAQEYVNVFNAGSKQTTYPYCKESLTKIANILVLKRDIELPPDECQKIQLQCNKVIDNYIPVTTLNDTISKIAYSISINRPCLIRAPNGSGKTSILDYIAAHTNRLNPPEYLKVQIGDQIDSKLLIGSYVCTDIPGQSEWQPGPLTKAMAYGAWIVFEDIDSAPSDMAQVIHSVLENGNLSCVSCCPIKLDSPHPDFRIFFTQQISDNRTSENVKIGFGFVEKLCDIVDLPDLTEADLEFVIQSRFMFGRTITGIVIKLFKVAKSYLKSNRQGRATRIISYRDLFKFCDRLLTRDLICDGESFNASCLETIYLDAIECFLLSLPKESLRDLLMEFGSIINLAEHEVNKLVFQRKPEIRDETRSFTVGRVRLESSDRDSSPIKIRSPLAYTRQTLQLLESVSVCIKQREPVLLVGETGVGKTSIVQHLANIMSTELIVINLSQQSDSSDLLGGYKPVEMCEIMRPMHDVFSELFEQTFDVTSNKKFLEQVNSCFHKSSTRESSQWNVYLDLICKLCGKALNNKLQPKIQKGWSGLYDKARKLAKRIKGSNSASSMALAFSEGSLIRAVQSGKWILLDEINLAEPDVLQCLLIILDSIKNSQVYLHNLNDDSEAIKMHPNFRVFACMNPSTDIGKRDLVTGTRGRFTEFFVDDVIEKHDLRLIVESYVKSCFQPPLIEKIVTFYLELRARSSLLSDISGNVPIYSLRTLCRALSICANNVCQNILKSLLESLKITFFQQLNEASVMQVMKLIERTIFDNNLVASLKDMKIPEPKDTSHLYASVEGFWIQKSNVASVVDESYILTESVRKNLRSLARIISLSQRKLPILIQGKTSVGKTSLITYLAKLTGNKCYRINNHEHTDLQEYVGKYVLKEGGELGFNEGLLVRAMKKGYWIILDELNLAPCELLEALNRVLDENRELFIPETREVIKAHSKFVLFATQNPPEEYAGRKLMSRAFRNRFIELHFDEIPSQELQTILEKKCEMSPQHSKKIVAVMKELQMMRRESGCFNGKSGFMTMRDLFRWGDRYKMFKREIPDDQLHDWDKSIATEGLILLEGRVRTVNEADTVKNILEKVFKCKLNRDLIYGGKNYSDFTYAQQFKHIYFSKEFQRLFVQLSRALEYREPVLLCGQTGCGKTTACQLYASMKKQELITYNCHLNTESADFVGGVRPSRIEDEIDSHVTQSFPWVDGPLVASMKDGAIFLMDEISLADDAVLERINSVLEQNRSITLTEKDGEEIYPSDLFRFVATMNPGGDYGKKELSPALRNRFTEIYCHNTTDINQIKKIIESSLSPSLLKPRIAPRLLSVMQQFLQEYYKNVDIISIRDILSWVQFLSKTFNTNHLGRLTIQEAIMNGAALVYFDQFGTCGHKTNHFKTSGTLKSKLRKSLKKLIEKEFGPKPIHVDELSRCLELDITHDMVCVKKFYLKKGPEDIYERVEFVKKSPTVRKNILKIVRAMQLDRPILLEGDPGAGKTSIVSALARATGNTLVRINLSEQTDISDLFGSDLPNNSTSDDDGGDDRPRFCWHDGPMLRAIKESHWILLDEMNLASQSVLEGLNACFDHRDEIFIPELNKRISVNRGQSRIFACQNPHNQGAARKGLPQSFLNRFTSIFIDSHSPEDLTIIVGSLFPQLSSDLVEKMVEFHSEVDSLTRASGYEFNLRDLQYWCELLTKYVNCSEFSELNLHKPDKFVQFVYLDRIRSADCRLEISELFEKIFGFPIYDPPYRDIRLGEHSFIMARSILPRKSRPAPHLSELCILKYQMPYMESIAKAIESSKMPIIVGETGVGKKSIVRILAGLTGNELNILGANRDMDTIELLGSYEQKSLQREILDLVDDAKDSVNFLVNSLSHREHASTWTNFFTHIWMTLYETSIRDLKLSRSQIMEAYRFQLSQMKDLLDKLEQISINDNERMLDFLRERIRRLMQKSLYFTESMYSSGNFEWIDSILVKSIKQGSWLMIDNANLLNPAILDRLNSLVEPNGVLSLNEKGCDQDGIEIITPHPDFRLILTMNPDHGELSRAMRNRGAEIFVQPRFYFEDFLMLLNQNGFEPEEKKACMTYCVMQTSYDVHKEITGESPEEDGSLLAYFGLNYISTFANQVRRGLDVNQLLASLLLDYYKQKGFSEQIDNNILNEFVANRMLKYGELYKVDLGLEIYKWRHLRHDLLSLTGGDAITAMLDRDNRIFFDDFNICAILKPEETIENYDIVNTCTAVKIFLELSTHGDFEYRKGFIRETFLELTGMMNTVNAHVDQLHTEYIPLIESLVQRTPLIPVSEMHVDTRNSPDVHYYLQSLDYEGTNKREGLQNRWLLSLQRIMLKMIVELVEARSIAPETRSLWDLSEDVREQRMTREELIRPCAEIASDIYDLLSGILTVVSNRCFDNQIVVKVLPKLFWIYYFICKLKRHYEKPALLAICNQIPMLWALTYQKIIVPIIKDCQMADLSYKNKKFSFRIQHICDFLDVTITKPGHTEKAYHRKVVNMYAATIECCEVFQRQVDRSFAEILDRYTARPYTVTQDPDHHKFPLEFPHLSRFASGYIWSNSNYMKASFHLEEVLLSFEITRKISAAPSEEHTSALSNALNLLREIKEEYERNIEKIRQTLSERSTNADLRTFHDSRLRYGLDHFAPVWQFYFLQTRLTRLSAKINQPMDHCLILKQFLQNVDGLVISPKYYMTVLKYLHSIEKRRETIKLNPDDSIDKFKSSKDDADMYTAYLADRLIENAILDHQVVGWTKQRVTTSNLPASAPFIPEYSPIISLVGGYCLDASHLKLNACSTSSTQLDSFIRFLWNNYSSIKSNIGRDVNDLELARSLLHLRVETDVHRELLGPYICETTTKCECLEEYIRRRVKTFDGLIRLINEKLDHDDVETFSKALKLIYFGYLNYLEYAPMFTTDPAVRSREKLQVYRSELAHIKLDLHYRNTLFYWKTGENLQLNEIDTEEAILYPFSTRILVERRVKLEKSINRLLLENTNRPDDGSLYEELRKDVKIHIGRYNDYVHNLVNDISTYILDGKMDKLVSTSRRIIKYIEKSILRFRSEYASYADLTTNFLVGACFVQQGIRCLYARLEQKMQIMNLGFTGSIQNFTHDISQVFSFNNFTQGNIKSVHKKLNFYKRLGKVCPENKISQVHSIMLRTVLVQLNHHITITPSDIEKCIPIVRRIADLFNLAWNEKKRNFEDQRRKKEELYQYKPNTSLIGISFERQEFLDICSRFPTYDHVYEQHTSIVPTSSEKENLRTEKSMMNLCKSVDLSMCIDICKAHYKFIKEASGSLLGHVNSSKSDQVPSIDLKQLIRLEAETFYSIIRHCMPYLNKGFDSQAIECHLLEAHQLKKALRPKEVNNQLQGSLKSSIEILDEEIFDIYHDANTHEALRFQDYIVDLNKKIADLKDLKGRGYDSHTTLHRISSLTSLISSFLLIDPFMKFVTGSHNLLEKIEDWNNQSIPREEKMLEEALRLIELIKSWRQVEVESWRSSLHHVKKKYIDSRLCDLWFDLYDAFNNPIVKVREFLRKFWNDDSFTLGDVPEETLYQAFVGFIKEEFLETATYGDYQIRLDLVFSFAIQTRFASLYKQAQPNYSKDTLPEERAIVIDFEKLTTYIFNLHRQFQGLLESVKDTVETEEAQLLKELNTEIRIVAWQGRNLWEIKNNFRISHRKLNKVMSKYLCVLQRPIIGIGPKGTISNFGLNEVLSSGQESEKLNATLAVIQMLVEDSKTPVQETLDCLQCLEKSPNIVNKLKELYSALYMKMSPRYMECIASIEQAIIFNTESIQNFHSHKVQDVIIHPRDSMEERENKHKLCRQIHHGKKFAMQSVFKNLRNLGISYQRGLNSQESLDRQILSLEPLRGLIQNQSNRALEAAAKLVDDNLIFSCNNQYRKLIAASQILTSRSNEAGLNTDQMDRIRGLTLDMVLDITKHYGSAAYIYKHLMSIQAATIRLTELQEISSKSRLDEIVICNFSKVHKAIYLFNDLVGRAYLTITKSMELFECQPTAIPIDNQAAGDTSDSRTDAGEKAILDKLISETEESDSLITPQQLNKFKLHSNAKKDIAEISSKLRNLLSYDVKNHMFSTDDMEFIKALYDQFFTVFGQLVPADVDGSTANSEPGTVLHSLKMLLNEAENKLKPELDKAFLSSSIDKLKPVDLSAFSKISNLNVRISKLIKQIKMAAQEIYKKELNQTTSSTQANKQNSKPFNFIDSTKICQLLRTSQVAKHIGDCFVTLNHAQFKTNIEPIVKGLTPILFIYTQDIAYYLNIILTSLHLKLGSTCDLLAFFTDLVLNGFGLPYKMTDEGDGNKVPSKGSEDNAGFGEGQGDTDVSNKLEFESQLDDIKNGKEDEQNDAEKDKSVKANDDGVEMSDDIDTKAEGADPTEIDSSGELDDEQDQNLDDLDKELDKVDQDEGRLDENLWGDKDEPIGEDDEEDLREAEADSSVNPQNEETSLAAKDDTLIDSKPDSKTVKEEKPKILPEETMEKIDKAPDDNKDTELNLDDEAAQALKELPPTTKDQETTSDAQENEIDMSISDDDDQQPTNQDDGDATEKDLDKRDDKSEGELTEAEEQDDDELDTNESQNPLDDSMIYQQLEEPLLPSIDDQLADPIEETLQNHSAQGQTNKSGPKKVEGRKIGGHTLYEFFKDDQEDLSDSDEDFESVKSDELEDNGGNSDERQNDDGPGVNGSNADKNNGADRTKVGEGADPEEADEKSAGKSQKSTKRTLAERQEVDAENETKRQKIVDDPVAEREEDGTVDKRQTRASKRVKHIEKDEGDALECIDLVSSSEDDYLDAQQQLDCKTNLMPLPKEKETGSKVDQADIIDLISSDEEATKGTDEPSKDESSKSTHNDLKMDTSSIGSSFESGELRDSDDSLAAELDEFKRSRDLTSSYNTNLGLLKYISLNEQMTNKDKSSDLMKKIDQALNNTSQMEHTSVDIDILTKLWVDCTRQTGHLVQELCQQLQIVLQPTKMSKYKGDYKSGKRLNMRKIVSYIASHYRKDKIWLRRTKPSRRTYNITIAVDNSSSMSENNCRQMTYQSLALLAKSLSLIEAGSLSVVSFGERVNCIHEFDQPYVDAIGAQWLRDLRFNENRTSYKQLLSHSCESFANQAQLNPTNAHGNIVGSVSQLLIIISDGRNVTNEEDELKRYLRQLKSMGVLTLFVIIDDLDRNGGNSIADTKRPLGVIGANCQMVSYMELFPFPFYVLLRRLDAMPSILGDALRQWFELVSTT